MKYSSLEIVLILTGLFSDDDNDDYGDFGDFDNNWGFDFDD